MRMKAIANRMKAAQIVMTVLAIAFTSSNSNAEESGFLQLCLAADEFENFSATIAACDNDTEIQKLDSKSKALVYWQMGTAYHWSQDFENSLRLFDQSIALDTTNAEAFNQRGWSKYLSGDNTGAEADFMRAIEVAPKLGNPYMGMAFLLSATPDVDAVFGWYDKMTAAAPDYHLGQYNYAEALMQIGRSSEALPIIERVLTKTESELAVVEVIRSAEDKELGLNFLAYALELKAKILISLDRKSEAKEVYIRLGAKWPNNPAFKDALLEP
jgi:tetratricopeptide (TPR) repeat protein